MTTFIDLARGQPCPQFLREEISRWLNSEIRLQATLHGLCQNDFEVKPEEIFISCGNSMSLYMLCAQILGGGGILISETPTYFGGVLIFRDLKIQIKTVSVNNQGLDLSELELLLQKIRSGSDAPIALYTIPTFHNPTSVTMPVEHRRKLIRISQQYRVLIFSDEAYQFLPWGTEHPPPPLYFFEKEYCQNHPQATPGLVFSLESFSKLLAPGLRLGWIHCSIERVNELTNCGFLISGGGLNPFSGLPVATMIQTGSFQENLERLRTRYSLLNNSLLNALDKHFHLQRLNKDQDLSNVCQSSSSKLRAVLYQPVGGYFIWLYLPDLADSGITTNLLAQKCLKEYDLRVFAGDFFNALQSKDDSIPRPTQSIFQNPNFCLRLTTVALDNEELIEEGIGRIASAARALLEHKI
eukprot:TRINITY_DN3700_c0_g1_i1.p1 TRINITY_DN3700_c0_g1~~TRINITY_DN3700_c0_g1_i1.p1  ORF type:complete len:427 (+),score=91.02 TRINITY_DN3700_c0_g1_i1:50-1282(+)